MIFLFHYTFILLYFHRKYFEQIRFTVFSKKILRANSVDPDQTPRFVCMCPPNVYRFRSKRGLNASWLVGCFGLNGPLRQYFSLYRAVSQREGERIEK